MTAEVPLGIVQDMESIPLPCEPENPGTIPHQPKDILEAKPSSGQIHNLLDENNDRVEITNADAIETETVSKRQRNPSFSLPRMYMSAKSCTLPANSGSKFECKILDVDNLPKLSKWDTFKSKIYLSSAFGGTSRRMTTMKESKCCSTQHDLRGSFSQEHDYSTIEGLDLGGLPPMSHKSRKMFSWSKFMHGVRGKKDKDIVLDTKEEEETAKVEKKFSIAWFQKKFRQGKGNSPDEGFGNGEVPKEDVEEEVKSIQPEESDRHVDEEVS